MTTKDADPAPNTPTGGDSNPAPRPGGPVVRTWRGTTRAEDADAYLAYLHATGFAEYRAAPGNLGVLALRRVAGGRAEWLLVTLWETESAVRGFAGDDRGRAVFYPEDDRFLIERDDHADHWEPAFAAGWEALASGFAGPRSVE